MAQIIQFPERKEKVQLEKQMEEMQESLTELYDAIRRIDSGFQAIQNTTLELEDSYQELIQLYADIVGPKNVEVKWLEYCTFVSMIHGEDGEVEISFTPPEDGEDL
jgi:DNA anti-recombination protein RmuC